MVVEELREHLLRLGLKLEALSSGVLASEEADLAVEALSSFIKRKIREKHPELEAVVLYEVDFREEPHNILGVWVLVREREGEEAGWRVRGRLKLPAETREIEEFLERVIL